MGMLLGVAHSSCGCEGAVDIEEADGVLDRALSERRDDAGGGSGSGHGVRIFFLFAYVLSVCVWLCVGVLCRKLESAQVLNVNVSEEKQECPVGSECLFM